jgi:hypothetical protein
MIEPIGVLTVVVGFLCLRLGTNATFATFVVSALFGSAAALLIGSANIQPPHLLLGFAAVAVLRERREAAAALNALSFPKPGFWLTCLVLYGVCAGVFVPHFLEGGAQIVPLGASARYADTGSTVPLGPVSGNFTQAIYLIADLMCFAMTVAVASTEAGFAAIAAALLGYAIGNLLFALLDLLTFAGGVQFLLEFMRNAQYTLHNEEEISGLKRIVGSFPEASAFARATLGALGFTATLWLCGRRPFVTGALAAASLVLVVLSTSSSGLAGTPLILAILYATALARLGVDRSRPFRSTALLCAPILAAIAAVAVLLDDKTSAVLKEYFDMLIFDKSMTESGIERESWNIAARQNFFDSYGLGVGLGTARTSSFPLALLSNVGAPGTLFYLLFAATALGLRRGAPLTFHSDVRLAARNGCLGLLAGDLFVAPTVEQGLLFYVLTGVASAEPERDDGAPIGGAPDPRSRHERHRLREGALDHDKP